MTVDQETLRAGLSLTLDGTELPELGTLSRGKVRDSYITGDGRRILVTTDRISAVSYTHLTLPTICSV